MLLPYLSTFRLVAHLSIYYSLYYNRIFTKDICGQFTHPPLAHLIAPVVLVELIRSVHFGQPQTYFHPPARIATAKIGKYLLIFLIKLYIITGESDTLKYYLHSLLLELLILALAVASEFINKYSIGSTLEILFIDGLFRVTVVYQLTQTFCPSIFQYHLIVDLIALSLLHIELQARDCNNGLFYVHQNVYRLLVIAFIYYGLFEATQLTVYPLKTLFSVGVLKMGYQTIRAYADKKYESAVWLLWLGGLSYCLLETQGCYEWLSDSLDL